MSDYDIVIPTPVNLGNVSSCIPNDLFLQFLQNVVLKTDAIKLGVVCFIAGIATQMLIEWLYARYGHGNS
jgi:hypothetical protein